MPRIGRLLAVAGLGVAGLGVAGLVGYVGLRAHGAPQDVVSFRDIRIRDLSDRD